MRIKFWGVRGSTPTPQAENLRYGGNTSCVEVRLGDQIYIFDCGTGFRVLGHELLREFGDRPFAAHVFVSHFHWDHIQGMPFFRPLYDNPKSQFHFHASSRTRGLQQVMAEQMAAPYFPVNLAQMRAQLGFYNIENGCLPMGDGIHIKTAWLNHPQGCMGFRLETKEGVLVYATDNEPGDPNFDKAVRKLAEGADILIYDAQYLPEEYEARRRGWGHSQKSQNLPHHAVCLISLKEKLSVGRAVEYDQLFGLGSFLVLLANPRKAWSIAAGIVARHNEQRG
jgi:phosphoribosyl 1,2-cyclic phosphodiesterase